MPLTAIQRLLPDLQVMHVSVCLQSVCVSVVSSCREPAVSSALRDYASAFLTMSRIPASDIWPIHHTRKAVMFTRRNLLECAPIRVESCDLTIYSKERIVDYEAGESVLVFISLSFSVGDRGRWRRGPISARFQKFRHGTAVKTS